MTIDPAQVKTGVQLTDYMVNELKLDPTTVEFTKKFMATQKHFKLQLR